jgi:hypothetical protein
MKSPTYFATFNSKHSIYVPRDDHPPTHELQIAQVPTATSLASVSTAASSVSMGSTRSGKGMKDKVKKFVKRVFVG